MRQSDYPLASLYHTKNLAKKIAEDQELDIKVSFSTDKQTAVLGAIPVTLSSFGVMYRGLLAEIEKKQPKSETSELRCLIEQIQISTTATQQSGHPSKLAGNPTARQTFKHPPQRHSGRWFYLAMPLGRERRIL